MRAQRSPWRAALGAVAVSGAALLAVASPALAQDGGGAPDPSQAPVQERVSAQVLPGVVRVGMASDAAYVVNPQNPAESYAVPDGVGGSCTGFVVSADGYVGTAGHCVDPDSLGDQARVAVANSFGAQGYDANVVYQNLQSFVVSGDPGGRTPLQIAVALKPSNAKPEDKALDAKVVDLQGPDKGDVALLKVDATNLMTVPLATDDQTPVGEPIMAIGYPGAREDSGIDTSLAPVTQEGRVSSQQSKQGVPYTEITADLGHGMSGGPTVDQQGQVIGINASLANEKDSSAQFNYISPVSRLREMAARAGVNTAPGPVDTAYRAGLEDYFQGFYSAAGDEFDAALAVAPGNRSAQEYEDKASRAHEQFGDAGLFGLTWSTLGYLGGGVAALLIVAGSSVVALLRRRRGPAAATGTPLPVGPHGAGPAPEAPVVPGPRRPEYPQSMPSGGNSPALTPHQASAPARGGRGPETGPASPPVGFPSPIGPSIPAPDGAVAVTEKVVRPTGGTVAPERPRVAAGFCPRCGAARTTDARFCGSCGVDRH